MLVSHDRYLIDRLATQIWHLEDGVLRIFKGNYQEFLAAENRRMEEPEPVKVVGAGTTALVAAPAPKAAQKAKPPKKSEAVSKLEAQIHSVETSLKELDQLLQRASAAQKVSTVEQLGQQYAAQQNEMETLMARWTELSQG